MEFTEHELSIRRGLIFSLALVALYGLEQERITSARLRNLEGDYTKDPDVLEVRRVHKEANVYNREVYTSDKGILDRLAYTQQTARLSYLEWANVVKIRRLT